MLRASCSILIKTLRAEEKIDEKRETECLKFVMKPENHRTIRNLVAMILLPKQLHKNDKSNAAYLRAAVSRVSCTIHFLITVQIANPTVLEKPGAFMLAPIYRLLFGQCTPYSANSLELTEDQVAVTYKTYRTDDPAALKAVVDQKLAPGKMASFHFGSKTFF